MLPENNVEVCVQARARVKCSFESIRLDLPIAHTARIPRKYLHITFLIGLDPLRTHVNR